MKIIYTGKVDAQGRLKITNRLTFDKELQAFAGKDVVITLEKKSRKRSVQQNRYYYGICVEMVWQRLRHLGHEVSREDTHEILKSLFNKKELINENTGEIISYAQSTTALSTTDFMAFIADIQKWAAEKLDIYIPDPLEHITETV